MWMKTVLAAAAAACAVLTAGTAHADVDFENYYKWLRNDGFLVVGNEQYLVDLAMTVCNLEIAGYEDSDIGDYIAQRENMTHIQGFTLFLDASIQVCSQVHPRLLPPDPRPPLPPGYYDDGD